MARGRVSEFVAHVVDLLAPLGPVAPRAMFGGWGLYLDGRMFALIADDTLYLKVDGENRDTFEAAGSAPFTYAARGRTVALSYWQAPAEAMEDAALLLPLAEGALAAAARAARAGDRSRAKTGRRGPRRRR